MTTLPVPRTDEAPPRPRGISRRARGADAVFENTSRTIGASVLVITGGIGVFLALQSVPTLKQYGWSFFTETQWDTNSDKLGVRAVLVGTFEIAMVAMVIAFPLALATALYISEYAPARLKPTLVSLVDLMAAVPSIVYGLWGFFFIEPHAADLAVFLQRHFAWTGVLDVPGTDPDAATVDKLNYTASSFIAGIAVSMMVLPMACAVMRQVFSQTPQGEKEAALALGSTRWGMVRTVVLPFGRGGIIGGTMLGLGRALGETIAVLLIISPVFDIKASILQVGGSSVSSLIAGQFGESTGVQLKALLTAGFVLFLITLLVNTLASIVVNRSRSGAETG